MRLFFPSRLRSRSLNNSRLYGMVASWLPRQLRLPDKPPACTRPPPLQCPTWLTKSLNYKVERNANQIHIPFSQPQRQSFFSYWNDCLYTRSTCSANGRPRFCSIPFDKPSTWNWLPTFDLLKKESVHMKSQHESFYHFCCIFLILL